MFDSLWQDIRFGAGQIRRRPRLAGVIVLCLALGTGPNTAVFSLIHAVLMRPMDLHQPERLALVGGVDEDILETVSFPFYEELAAQGGAVFEGVMASSIFRASAGHADGAELIIAEAATSNYFEVLGVEAALGRTFVPAAEELPGRQPYVVLGHRYWSERFGADPRVIGRVLPLNGFDFEIVGVMPPTFNGTSSIFQPQMWVPVMMIGQIVPADSDRLTSRTSDWIFATGRLAEGVDLDRANQEIGRIAAGLAERFPDAYGNDSYQAQAYTQLGLPVPEAVQWTAALVVLGFVGLILLVACASIAALMLARSTERYQEIAVRLGLGARRGRVVRQLLVESLLLSLAAGLLGLLMALWAFEFVPQLLPDNLPIPIQIGIDARLDGAVLAYTLLSAVVATLVAGLAPALRLARVDLFAVLKGQPESGGADAGTSRLRDLFLIGQFAVSVLLLAVGGLAFQSLQRTMAVDPGFASDRILLFPTDLALYGYAGEEQRQFADDLLEALAQVPGVEAATMARTPPMGFDRTGGTVAAFDEGMEMGERMRVNYSLVGTGYFAALGIDLLAGRAFTAEDRAYIEPVAVVNQALADTLFADGQALGQYLHFGGDDAYRIVGVAANIANMGPGQIDVPFLYVPLALHFGHGLVYALRTEGAPRALVPAVEKVIRGADPAIALNSFQTMQDAMDFFLLPVRLLALLGGVLGGLALLLAGVGIFGAVSYSVRMRRREVGIRLALGGRPTGLVWLLMRSGLVVLAWGGGLGLVLALGAATALAHVLEGVNAVDPIVLVGTPLLLGAVGLAGVAWPAWRTVRLVPMAVLRYE
ncbi:MAG: FtsX-like permease family protein [Candidatus Latescibacteria bacterium]|nr:FtsX-like permease family protein [Candidatus Latescibacterota bacterium]